MRICKNSKVHVFTFTIKSFQSSWGKKRGPLSKIVVGESGRLPPCEMTQAILFKLRVKARLSAPHDLNSQALLLFLIVSPVPAIQQM